MLQLLLPFLQQSQQLPAKFFFGTSSSHKVLREYNLISFGLPENNSLLELKSTVDELLEFLAGSPIKVNDLFQLGKSGHPWPVLLKLTNAWDRS